MTLNRKIDLGRNMHAVTLVRNKCDRATAGSTFQNSPISSDLQSHKLKIIVEQIYCRIMIYPFVKKTYCVSVHPLLWTEQDYIQDDPLQESPQKLITCSGLM